MHILLAVGALIVAVGIVGVTCGVLVGVGVIFAGCALVVVDMSI